MNIRPAPNFCAADAAILAIAAQCSDDMRRFNRRKHREFVRSYSPALWRPKALLNDIFDEQERANVICAPRALVIRSLRRLIRHLRALVEIEGRSSRHMIRLRTMRLVYLAERLPSCRFASRANIINARAVAFEEVAA